MASPIVHTDALPDQSTLDEGDPDGILRTDTEKSEDVDTFVAIDSKTQNIRQVGGSGERSEDGSAISIIAGKDSAQDEKGLGKDYTEASSLILEAETDEERVHKMTMKSEENEAGPSIESTADKTAVVEDIGVEQVEGVHEDEEKYQKSGTSGEVDQDEEGEGTKRELGREEEGAKERETSHTLTPDFSHQLESLHRDSPSPVQTDSSFLQTLLVTMQDSGEDEDRLVKAGDDGEVETEKREAKQQIEELEAIDDNSPARLEWVRQKREGGARNTGLDRLMCMVGIENVKAEFLSMKNAVDAAERRGDRFHVGLIELEKVTGNPGTGKRTIKRHFEVFKDELCDSKDTSGKGRASIYSRYEKCEIHEAHSSIRNIHIDDFTDDDIYQILKSLFKRRSLAIEGGFDGPEFTLLVRRIARTRKMSTFRNFWAIKDAFSESYDRAADRVHKERIAWERGCKVGDAPKDGFFTRRDIVGEPPIDIRERSPAYKELQAMVGMEHVKEEAEDLMDRAKISYMLEMDGRKPFQSYLNRVILGPPGTGKSAAARLLGSIIAEIGLVSKRQVSLTDTSSMNVGDPTDRTRKVLDAAEGKALVIDNFDALCPMKPSSSATDAIDICRHEVLDTIVARTSTDLGQDRAILLVGYTERMSETLRKGNVGLQSRFPLADAIVLEDYDMEELAAILDKKVTDLEIGMSLEARNVALQILDRARDRPGFGNASAVVLLVDQARTRYFKRTKQSRNKAEMQGALLSLPIENKPATTNDGKVDSLSSQSDAPSYPEHLNTAVAVVTGESSTGSVAETAAGGVSRPIWNKPTILEPEDFDPDWKRTLGEGASVITLFEDFVGMEKVIGQLEGYQQIARGMRLHGKDPRPNIPFTFVFKGPPGTGKTSTARKIGQVFYDMGFLASCEVHECSASDIVGMYVGHTGPKVIDAMEKGLGKVLFIDEAYRLAEGSFQGEAIGELVDSLTKPRFMRKMVVILAGYVDDMDRLLHTNRGLKSRFATEILFPQLTPDQCLVFLGLLVDKMGIKIRDRVTPSEEEKAKVQRLLTKLGATKGWANGRDIETLAQMIIGEVYRREGRKGKKSSRLQVSTKDLIVHLQDMLRSRLAGEWQEREG